MERTYKIFIYILIFTGFNYQARAQELNCSELYDFVISSDPDNPINERHPQFEQQYFDWRSVYFGINWQGNTNQQEHSPFYQPGNDMLDHLKDKDDFKPEDGWELLNYNLGYNLMGNPIPNPKQNIYFILYNRYHAKLRVFVLLGSQQGGYSHCRIALRHSTGTLNTQQSGILEGAGEILAPLMEFERDKVISSTSRHLNNNSSWSYAEFHLTYDPCVCLHDDSRIHIEQSLIDVAAIALEGTSSGQIEALDVNNSSNPDGAKNGFYKDFTGFFNEVNGAVSAGNKSFKSYDKWNDALDTVSNAKAKSGVSHLLSTFSDDDNILGKGLKMIPYISEAVSIIDFFVGGGESKPSTVKMAPMSMDLKHKFTGTLTTVHPYEDIIFDVPGSSHEPYNGNPVEWYDDFAFPHYNKPLGVISILERPKVTTVVSYTDYHYDIESSMLFNHPSTSGVLRKTKRWYRFQHGLEYVVNPASGLEVQELHASIVVDLDPDKKGDFLPVLITNSPYGVHNMHLQVHYSLIGQFSDSILDNDAAPNFIKVNNTTYESNLLPISCLAEAPVYTEEVWEGIYSHTLGDENYELINHDPNLRNHPVHHPERVFIKLVFNLKRTDNQGNNVLLIYKVPVEIEDWGNMHANTLDWENEVFLNLLHNTVDDTLIDNKTISEDVFAWNSVTVAESNTDPLSTNDIYLEAGAVVDISPNTTINPNSTLQIKNFPGPCKSNDIIPPLGLDYVVANHCNDPRYQSKSNLNKLSGKSGITENSAIKGIDVKLFPNPTKNILYFNFLNFDQHHGDAVRISIINSQGRLVQKRRFNLTSTESYKIDVSALPPGSYVARILLIKSGEFSKNIRFLKLGT